MVSTPPSGPDPTAARPGSARLTPVRAGAAIDRFCAASPAWSTARVLDEGLDLARDTAWAERAVLVAISAGATSDAGTRCSPVRGALISEVARRPAPDPSEPTDSGPLDPGWFPWGLAPVNPRRFLLVGDARALPVAPQSAVTFGQLGIRSCLHLPVLERQHPIGALQLAWSSPRTDWDDRLGRLLRILGRLLLSRAGDDAGAAPPPDDQSGGPAEPRS